MIELLVDKSLKINPTYLAKDNWIYKYGILAFNSIFILAIKLVSFSQKLDGQESKTKD